MSLGIPEKSRVNSGSIIQEHIKYAGFSNEKTASLTEVITDAVGFRHSSLADHPSNLRIKILAVALKPQVERQMIGRTPDD
jgi:hypothetical protein